MSIGNRIKQRRKELKMSADELAAHLGKDRSTIYRYEKGEIENLPLDILEPIAKALKTSPAYLMGWEKAQKNNERIVTLITRLRTDEEFLSIVEALNNMEPEKLNGLRVFLK